MRTLVVLPTYNEAENIDTVLRRVRAAVPDVDILVVDDGSPDGTADLAEKTAAQSGRIEVLRRAAKSGADLVIGSRYVPGGRIPNWPW